MIGGEFTVHQEGDKAEFFCHCEMKVIGRKAGEIAGTIHMPGVQVHVEDQGVRVIADNTTMLIRYIESCIRAGTMRRIQEIAQNDNLSMILRRVGGKWQFVCPKGEFEPAHMVFRKDIVLKPGQQFHVEADSPEALLHFLENNCRY